jgi:ribosome-binding ATPase YchF (GTP1/OBG family)
LCNIKKKFFFGTGCNSLNETIDLIKYGSEKKVKDAGMSKLQGKEYIVEDGDCIYFHFNV